MNSKFFTQSGLCLAAMSILAGTIFAPAALASKKYTITKRVDALSWRINAGERSGELTLKEATSLRKKIADVNDRISKDKDNNGGKLSYADENKIEKELNGVSVKLTKKELAKRLDAPLE